MQYYLERDLERSTIFSTRPNKSLLLLGATTNLVLTSRPLCMTSIDAGNTAPS